MYFFGLASTAITILGAIALVFGIFLIWLAVQI